MYRVTRELLFCYGHRLLNYDGQCAHPHGHNGKVEIEITADHLDARGMVVDFIDIKRLLKEWIDENLDHRMILRKDDPLAKVLIEMGEPVFMLDVNPTAESLARLIYEYARSQGFSVTQVRLWETDSSFATYRPSNLKEPCI
ncbi:MAG: 6-carboxytetrahydropterin synthase [Acidobacteria bacterium]|nr:6-carboxytetrahydropterin synthase [Acidobacteriota bacterium]MBI3656166.1 6-carboxytetrahydropterin synthase [Acidobacteriota bacterium]